MRQRHGGHRCRVQDLAAAPVASGCAQGPVGTNSCVLPPSAESTKGRGDGARVLRNKSPAFNLSLNYLQGLKGCLLSRRLHRAGANAAVNPATCHADRTHLDSLNIRELDGCRHTSRPVALPVSDQSHLEGSAKTGQFGEHQRRAPIARLPSCSSRSTGRSTERVACFGSGVLFPVCKHQITDLASSLCR